MTVVPVGPAALRFEGFAPTIIIDGPDSATGDAVIKVNAPGATSEARLSKDGLVSLTVEGAGEIGRRGEPQALKTLRQKLQADGLTVTVSREAACDASGEDASLGSALTQVQIQGALDWIRGVLNKKIQGTRPVQWANTVLAIDARHAGVFATAPIIENYLSRFNSPIAEFGFASVWIVGPMQRYCTRLGPGSP